MKRLIACLGTYAAVIFVLSTSAVLAQDACEGNFDCDQDCDGSDSALFKIDFGRSEFNMPCIHLDTCNGDFDCDSDVDGGDAALFKSDFGRSLFNNPCPPSCPTSVLLAKTGQSASHHDDDDGDYQRGVEWPSPRFVDNEDGTVTDYLTGLIWTKDTHPSGGYKMSWQEALDYVKAMNAETNTNFDHTDWRVPNIKELLSLVDYGEFCPALPLEHPFVTIGETGYYWSSTFSEECCDPDDQAWYVHFGTGLTGIDETGWSLNYVLPVRGGQQF